jgi:hypothetical protein
MLLKNYGHDDKGKWFIMPDDNVDKPTMQTYIDNYHKGDYRRINHGHYMDYNKYPEYYDRVYAQNHVLDVSYLKEIDNLEAYFLSATKVDLDYLENLNTEYLEYLVMSFTHKSVGQFLKSNKIDLSFVTKFENLKLLFLGPDVVSPIKISGMKFPKLLELTMHYDDISKVNFSCFPTLQSLQVRSKGNGIEYYNLGQLTDLRQLSISGFPESQNLDFISDLQNLEILSISGFQNIKKLPNFSKLKNLKWVFIGCKGIEDYSNFVAAPNLLKVSISGRLSKDFDIELFRPITESKSLQEFGYSYDYQTKAEEKKLIEMFGDRYNPMSKKQIFLLEGGGHHIIE